jgi:hypothetical protein
MDFVNVKELVVELLLKGRTGKQLPIYLDPQCKVLDNLKSI